MLKPLGLLFICLLVVSSASAQEAAASASQTPPGVVTLKLKWSKEIQFPHGWDRSTYDASSPINDPFPADRRTGMTVPNSPFPPSGRLPYVYHYSAKIRNDGAKEIKAMIWEYVLSEPGGNKQLGRHRFYSYEKVGAEKTVTLKGKSSAAPSKIASVAGLEKDKRSPYDERLEIKCVMYTDGTWWRSPAAKESECFILKNSGKPDKRANRQ